MTQYPTSPANISSPTASAAELHEWQMANGPLYCPYCGHHPVTVELCDTHTQPRELLSCEKCHQSAEFVHPPFGARLPLLGAGLGMARARFLTPWQARPHGVRLFPQPPACWPVCVASRLRKRWRRGAGRVRTGPTLRSC